MPNMTISQRRRMSEATLRRSNHIVCGVMNEDGSMTRKVMMINGNTYGEVVFSRRGKQL